MGNAILLQFTGKNNPRQLARQTGASEMDGGILL
jgi:hypothetical protein